MANFQLPSVGASGWGPTLNNTLQHLKENQVVNVKALGAKGDGSTNDTAIIQNALNNGGRIYIPSGTYMVDPLYTVDYTSIFGDGDSTVLKRRPATVTNPDSVGTLNVHGTASVPFQSSTIRDLKIDANKAGLTVNTSAGGDPLDQEGLSYKYTSRLHVQNVTVINSYSEGFDFDDCTDGLVLDCAAYDCDGGGYHFSNGSVRMRAVGCFAKNCGMVAQRAGFDSYSGSTDSRFDTCTSLGCYYGFRLDGQRPTAVNCHDDGSLINNYSINGTDAILQACTGLNAGTSASPSNGVTVRAAASKCTIDNCHFDGATANGVRVLAGAIYCVVTSTVAENSASASDINHQANYGIVANCIGRVAMSGTSPINSNNVAGTATS